MALQVANVDGLDMVLKRIDRAIEFNKKDMAQMRKLNRQVVQIYVRYLRRPGRIKDAKEVIKVKGRDPIKPGTLRNSVGTWSPNKNRATMLDLLLSLVFIKIILIKVKLPKHYGHTRKDSLFKWGIQINTIRL